MAIDRDTLAEIIDLDNPTIKAVVDAIEPYFPVLKRMGEAALGDFLDALKGRDWSRIDRALYASMTEDERDRLSEQVLRDARAVVDDAYETKRTFKDDLLRVSMGILLSFI
jgi:single-stranded DNA-specific DHH superfamily exonuclease